MANVVDRDLLRLTAKCMLVLAGLIAVGAIIGGIELVMHMTSACDDARSITQNVHCGDTRHSLVGAGVAVLVGGFLQAAVIAALGYIAGGLADVRDRLNGPARRSE